MSGSAEATTAPPVTPLWSKVGSAAMAKVVVVAMSGVLGIVTARVMISTYGVEIYAQYGLLTTLTQLLPFADLGLAAVVINTLASSATPAHDETVRRTLTSAMRFLCLSGLTIALGSTLIFVLGLWPTLLGDGLVSGGALTAWVCLVIFGLGVPLGLGQRILIGLQRNTSQIAAQTVVAPFLLCVVGISAVLSLPIGAYLPIAAYIGNVLVSILCLGIAARALRPQLRRAVRDVPRLRTVRNVPVFNLAWPMLVQMMALPLAMQTHRILLSHLGSTEDLAEYTLAFQLFGLALQAIAAAGVSLWPHFARARADGAVESPWRATGAFVSAALLVGVLIASASGPLAALVSDGKIVLSRGLVVAFVVFIGLQAAKYPLGMYLTDERGLRFQVLPTMAMIPIGLGLSWTSIPAWGPSGAVIGSAAAVLLCQVIPYAWYIRKDLARRRLTTRPSTCATPG